jgi:signal-transduction protein with cAMP-binding, CBS, and nucleotidyltransferase domain
MRPAITTVERDAHLAAATYLFKKAGDTALVVVDDEVGMMPIAVITDADVAQAVADGRDPNDVRINSVVSRDPMTVARETGVAEAAELMLHWQLTHLPVVDGTHLVGIVDMNAVCRGLLGTRAGGG